MIFGFAIENYAKTVLTFFIPRVNGYFYYAPSELYNHSSVRRIYSSWGFYVNKFFKSVLYF